MNNFFTFGDGKDHSALHLAIRSDILDNPSLLSSGKPSQSLSTGTSTSYTYELGAGSNESLLDMLKLQDTNISFGAAGGLPELTTTINFYLSEIYNSAASEANTAAAEADKNSTLKDALSSKLDDISGVNLDEELANSIMVQNTYAAAAKVLGIVRDLFDKIEQVLG